MVSPVFTCFHLTVRSRRSLFSLCDLLFPSAVTRCPSCRPCLSDSVTLTRVISSDVRMFPNLKHVSSWQSHQTLHRCASDFNSASWSPASLLSGCSHPVLLQEKHQSHFLILVYPCGEFCFLQFITFHPRQFMLLPSWQRNIWSHFVHFLTFLYLSLFRLKC